MVGEGYAEKLRWNCQFSMDTRHIGISFEFYEFRSRWRDPFQALERAIRQAERVVTQIGQITCRKTPGNRDNQEREAFMNSVERGDSAAVKKISCSWNQQTRALAVALRNGRTDVVSLLLQSMDNGHSYDLFDAIDASANLDDFSSVN